MTTPNSATHGAAKAAFSFSTTEKFIMTYTTHNTTEIDINGTSLQGVLTATYKELCDLFGKPFDGDGYKVDAEWGVRFEDGTVATIYNWKNGKNYCGAEGKAVEQIMDWHIGGVSNAAVDKVQITLDLHREMQSEAKPKDKMEEAFGSAIEIMNTIRSSHGQTYADAVEVALLLRKQIDLMSMLISAVVKADVIPEPIADMIHHANGVIQAKILAKMAKQAGVKDEKIEAETLMNWAEKLEEAEQSAAKTLLKEALRGNDQ